MSQRLGVFGKINYLCNNLIKNGVMRRKNYRYYLISYILLCMNVLSVHAADNDGEIIEFQGDRYVIHVDKMNPDSEMTLLDVLNTCPEFLSVNGKIIDQNYNLRIDNIDIVVDLESFLANVKACEIDRIQICNSSVAKAVSGTIGIIDLYYRTDTKTDGKASVSGSTYGNGMLYADVNNRSEKLAVQAYAMGRTSYGKAYPDDVRQLTNRGLAESLRLSINWKISPNDRLIFKTEQAFGNDKQELSYPDNTQTYSYYRRVLDLVLSYSHTFNNNAILFLESGCYYSPQNNLGKKIGNTYPYIFLELNTPILTPGLWLMVGTEADYENNWRVNESREQYLKTDFYAQLDYTHGPWVLTLGDRFRMMNFWNRQYDAPDRSMWRHGRNNHSYLASVGYKAGRHFLQARFARYFFMPVIGDFVVDVSAPTNSLRFDADGYTTNLVHQGVLRYSYQQKDLLLHTSVESSWYSDFPGYKTTKVGIRNALYWKPAESLELTLGANYYHEHLNSDVVDSAINDNYVTLKAAPVLHLPHGFRLSSVLLYSSQRDLDSKKAHLFATVKANKQLGKNCNVFAEFHDLAGYASGNWSSLTGLYQNRALSVGATFYPFRK